jgi:hypothetical protein
MLSPLPPPAQGQVGGAAGRIPCRPPPALGIPSRNVARDGEEALEPAGGSQVRRLQELSPAPIVRRLRRLASGLRPSVKELLSASLQELAAFCDARRGYEVSTETPCSVIATVCSKWAAGRPSAVSMVQPSGITRSAVEPSATIGSIASTRPGFSSKS